MSRVESDVTRILVAGCGAIGSVFACLLSERGHRLTVLGRGPHLDALARDGIEIRGIWGEHRSSAIEATSEISHLASDYDAVLIACKSYQTDDLLAGLGDRARPDGIAISLQNGLGNVERAARVYGPGRVLAGRVIFGAEIESPGIVAVTVEAEPVLFGVPGARADARAARWAAIVAEAGIRCAPCDDIDAALWAKVLYNAALNPLGALLGLRYGELAADAERRRIMDRVIDEAFRVARAEGVDLPWSDCAGYLEAFYGRLVPATADHRSSMLQDIERGRPTEIDAICGEVCRRGDRHGIDVATNRLLAMLVRARLPASGG